MVLEWWNGVVRWFASDAGQSVLTGTILPLIAIVAAGVIAGAIARGSMKRFIARQDREAKAAAVAALIASARKCAVWSSLTAQEKQHVELLASEAEVRVRLLAVTGSAQAADWSAHLITAIKRNSAAYAFQAEQDLATLQDGLIAWQLKPARTKKLFAQDIAEWKYASPLPEDELIAKQNEWAAQQETVAFETVR